MVIEKIQTRRSNGASLFDIKKEFITKMERQNLMTGSINMDQLAERIANLVRTEIYNFLQKKQPQ